MPWPIPILFKIVTRDEKGENDQYEGGKSSDEEGPHSRLFGIMTPNTADSAISIF